MRKQLLGVFIPLLVLALMAAAAETESASPARAALQKLAVTRGADGISLEITARGQVTPKLSSLDSPARLVLDLPNTVMATSQSHVDVSSEGVKGVRVGMDGQKTPTTRVVVDLEKACRYELVPGGDNKFTLKLYTNTVSAKAETKAAPKAPAAKLVMASAPVVSKPAVVVASAPVAEKKPAAVEAKTTASPTDFVFVEPSYKPKDETAAAKPTVEPSVKALEAAAKFADKPASELVAMKPSASLQQGAASQPAVNLAAEQKAQMTQTPATSGPKYTGEPISVNLKDVDLKDFFRLIHEISGLNVVLDPNVHGSLTVVLDDVPWDQALDIVLKNNDLARQLEGNVLRIATVETLKKEADARRAQIESEALAVEKVTITRFLSYAHSKDVVPTIKKFLTQRGDVISDDRTNALIISDIPNVVPTVDRLLTQLDRKTQEVEIEARVVAATRSFARDIGTQLGFGWGNGVAAAGGASSVGSDADAGWRAESEIHRDRRRFLDNGFDDPAVLEPAGNLADKRYHVAQCDQQLPHRRHPDDGGIARASEDSFPSASRHAEQYSSSGSPGRARAHRDAGSVGRTAHRDLRRRVPALDRNSADHLGEHDLPERGRGKHDA